MPCLRPWSRLDCTRPRPAWRGTAPVRMASTGQDSSLERMQAGMEHDRSDERHRTAAGQDPLAWPGPGRVARRLGPDPQPWAEPGPVLVHRAGAGQRGGDRGDRLSCRDRAVAGHALWHRRRGDAAQLRGLAAVVLAAGPAGGGRARGRAAARPVHRGCARALRGRGDRGRGAARGPGGAQARAGLGAGLDDHPVDRRLHGARGAGGASRLGLRHLCVELDSRRRHHRSRSSGLRRRRRRVGQLQRADRGRALRAGGGAAAFRGACVCPHRHRQRGGHGAGPAGLGRRDRVHPARQERPGFLCRAARLRAAGPFVRCRGGGADARDLLDRRPGQSDAGAVRWAALAQAHRHGADPRRDRNLLSAHHRRGIRDHLGGASGQPRLRSRGDLRGGQGGGGGDHHGGPDGRRRLFALADGRRSDRTRLRHGRHRHRAGVFGRGHALCAGGHGGGGGRRAGRADLDHADRVRADRGLADRARGDGGGLARLGGGVAAGTAVLLFDAAGPARRASRRRAAGLAVGHDPGRDGDARDRRAARGPPKRRFGR
ncbi:hypothetical protein Lokhon_02889 [Limimaricola hongkongensis DSM 17492]|uniref:Uncharacterized protein n=1 Tax=Limimaricola hongkongensis DSM 17492 TaxID=1122180 RepID=A0A017HA31_9RHOB|nr:hypothetical protein Lokhon_02889 [Limimaricola hongkongensis DSM 17492]